MKRKIENVISFLMVSILSLTGAVIPGMFTLSASASWTGYSNWVVDTDYTDTYTAPTDLIQIYDQREVVASYNYKTVYHYFRWSSQETGGTGSFENYSGYPNYYQYNLDYELSCVGTQGGYNKYQYWYSGSNYSVTAQ